MDIRFERRGGFRVFGYSIELNISSHERDIALLRDKYESKLIAISDRGLGLYFVTWLTKNDNYIYHFGVDHQTQIHIDETATCVEVPSGYYAVATVPKEMPILEAWNELFETALDAMGVVPNIEHGIYFEFFKENGVCEIWAPLLKW